jgi:tRNA (guanine-N7-)-methyltransferase
MPAPEVRTKAIRSFVIRQGRMTSKQRRALDNYFPFYGLYLEDGVKGLNEAFAHDAPLVVEIGYGMGDSLLEMAAAEQDKNFIGIEVHPPGVGNLLHELNALKLPNLRTYMADATDVLRECIAPDSIHRLQIYFPDPWPKKRHHKRRLVQPEFMELAVSCLQSGGIVHLATDWQPYAEHMKEVLTQMDDLDSLATDQAFVARPTWRPATKFERRGEKLGHPVFDLIYKKKDKL